MPNLKAFACRLRGFDDEDIRYAQTASKARYDFLHEIWDPYPSAKFGDVSVRRVPDRDMKLPDPPPVSEHLDDRDREVIVHSFGGGSHKRPEQWGYRDYYCCSPRDERLNRLVSLGVFRGPCGVDANGDTPGWAGAFYYLTDEGKTVAQALIGQRVAA